MTKNVTSKFPATDDNFIRYTEDERGSGEKHFSDIILITELCTLIMAENVLKKQPSYNPVVHVHTYVKLTHIIYLRVFQSHTHTDIHRHTHTLVHTHYTCAHMCRYSHLHEPFIFSTPPFSTPPPFSLSHFLSLPQTLLPPDNGNSLPSS